MEDSYRVGELSLTFLKHFEKCYYKFQEDRIHFCKSQFHMLLHLEQTIRECGPLVCTSQYVMERSIGFQVDRINAKTRVSEHFFKASLFSESYRLFYRLLYNKESKEFDETSSDGGVRLLGVRKECLLTAYEGVGQIREKLARYFVRKYDEVGLAEGRAISNCVESVTLYSRVRISCGSDTQTVSAAKFRTLSATSGDSERLSCFFAAEMDESDSASDIYYGLLQDIFEIDLSDAPAVRGVSQNTWRTHYRLILADWSSRIQPGRHGQIFVQGRVGNCFSGTTVEDASVLRRLISVVEHVVPRDYPWLRSTYEQRGNRSSQSQVSRGRRRTYFVDDCLLMHHLLSDKRSLDGVNRRLRGMIR